MLDSPLSGNVTTRRRAGSNTRKKVILGVAAVSVVPFLLSTFAASVTIGSGALEFGQGSQQAVACDQNVFIALGQEWHASPTPEDSSNGFFRVRTATISNINLEACGGRKLRLRMIDGTSAEIIIGNTPDAKVLQVVLPKVSPTSNITDSASLALSYLTGDGQPITGTLAANANLNVSGVSVYDGSSLSPTNADVMFYLDSSATQVNINGEIVRRATVETVNNPN
ncbi:MAG: hypothetical protein RL741_1441 [Actinomycetota bacterium]|jgi:hypothetical protein